MAFPGRLSAQRGLVAAFPSVFPNLTLDKPLANTLVSARRKKKPHTDVVSKERDDFSHWA